jgi:ribose transport system ATP-binding protein
LLEVDHVSKRFTGVQALDDVSLHVGEREVVGLVGQNGSGKTTLLKVIAGLHRPDSGSVRFGSRRRPFASPAEARAAGVGMLFQEQSLLPNLTVAENIVFGAEGAAVRGGFFNWPSVTERARTQLRKIGSSLPPGTATDSLTQGDRQMVELAKALVAEERTPFPLFLFDEGTSVLTGNQIDVFFEQVERLRKKAAIVFVSHHLDEVLRVADRVYVLKNGRSVAERRRGEATAEEYFRLMVGSELSADYYRVAEQSAPGHAVRLQLDGLALSGRFRDIDLKARVGEIVGICGVEGSGREALLRAVFGVDQLEAGRVQLDGRQVRFAGPADAVRAGVGLIPAERSLDAVFPELSVEANLTAAHLEPAMVGPLLDQRRERTLAREWIGRLGVRTPGPNTPMSQLSGGNQQKVVFARWMVGPDLRVLLLDHPTRGLDVGAKSDVYAVIRGLAAGGTTMLIISDSLEETIGLSHTVVTMRDGAITGRFEAAPDAKPNPVQIVERMM